MTLTSAQQVRLRINDQPYVADNVYVFDGSGYQFALPHRAIMSATAYITDANGRWSATGATFEPYTVSFAGTGSANSAFRVRYEYTTFTEDEISHFTAVGGDIVGASIEAVQTLMFDGLRRAAWAAPDGSEYDDTKAMQLLKDLYATLKNEQEQAAISDGAIYSWSITQGEL